MSQAEDLNRFREIQRPPSRRRLSIAAAADLVGVAKSSWQRWEHGEEPPPWLGWALAAIVFGLPKWPATDGRPETDEDRKTR